MCWGGPLSPQHRKKRLALFFFLENNCEIDYEKKLITVISNLPYPTPGRDYAEKGRKL